MASEGEEIVQNITLSGSDDVIEAFGEIASAGAKAMKECAEACEHALGPFGELTVAVAGLGAAFTALIGVTFAWAEKSSEAIHQLELLSDKTGEAVEDISALSGAIAGLGGSADHLSQVFRRMGVAITSEWEALKKEISGSSDAMVEAGLEVDKAEQAVFRAREARAKAFGQPGASPEELRLEKQKEANTALESAEETLWQAHKKREEARLDQPKQYLKAVEEVVHGEKTAADASKEANLSVDNIVKGLIGNTEGAAKAFENFTGNINSIVGEGPKVQQVFEKLADFIKNSGNEALNSAVLLKLFGRAMGTDLLPVLKQGSDAIRQNAEEMKAHGLVISHEETEKAVEFVPAAELRSRHHDHSDRESVRAGLHRESKTVFGVHRR
jgi:hypothetical protein